MGSSTITATDGAISGTTTLTVTAAALTSIAVTPGESVRGQGPHRAIHRHRHLHRRLDATSPLGHLDFGEHRVATISTSGLASTLATGTSTITATDGGISGSDDADRDCRRADLDRGDAGQSVGGQGADRAVHCHGDLHRRHDGQHHQLGDLGFGDTAVATISTSGLASTLATGTSTITATPAGSVSGKRHADASPRPR